MCDGCRYLVRYRVVYIPALAFEMGKTDRVYEYETEYCSIYSRQPRPPKCPFRMSKKQRAVRAAVL